MDVILTVDVNTPTVKNNTLQISLLSIIAVYATIVDELALTITRLIFMYHRAMTLNTQLIIIAVR